ncbi:MAG: TetR/AcrR family transcriptional regulator [Nocardioidaceae bacterium]
MTAQPYHHGNLRQALVETAVELARAKGPDGVVLREVARRAGVSHNAAYRHFADREQLSAEVAAVAMGMLERAMTERIAKVREKDPAKKARRRLREVGRAYVLYALAEPGLFEVAFSGSLHKDLAGPYAVLNRVLDEIVAAGDLAPERRAGAEVVCWSAVHGFASLHARGPLQVVPAAERDASLDQLLTTVDLGLR